MPLRILLTSLFFFNCVAFCGEKKECISVTTPASPRRAIPGLYKSGAENPIPGELQPPHLQSSLSRFDASPECPFGGARPWKTTLSAGEKASVWMAYLHNSLK